VFDAAATGNCVIT